MSATIFWRMLWKEYRAQRSFLISLAMLTLVVELLVVTSYRLFNPAAVAERVDMVFAAALGLTALYALASGATLFAMERDAETYEFLRGLPVTPLAVFAGKIAFALASTAALYVVAWMLALATVGQLPNPAFHRQIWALCGLGGIELMAWGILFSLLLRRPLTAVIGAATVASVIFLFVSLLWIAGGSVNEFIAVDPSLKAVTVRLLVVAILAAADIWLASRWFRERRVPALRLQDAGVERAICTAIDSPPSAVAMLGRLLWQEFRQSAALSAGLIGMLLPAILYVAADSIFRLGWHRIFNLVWPLVAIGCLFSAPLLGASVFLVDQTGCRFRFLAEHGIPPRLVWLSRQIRGLTVLLLGLLLILSLFIGFIATQRGDNLPREPIALAIESLLGFALVAYACGQLWSMGIRSGLLAAAFGTILTALICAWAAIMYWLCLSWLWSVAPLPLAFLFVTWLHAPAWLAERKSWRTRLCLALVVAVPVVAILVAVPLVRVYEIPLGGPGFDVAELTGPVTAEDQETLALYQRAVEFQHDAKAARAQAAAPGGSSPRATDEPAEQKAIELEDQAVALAGTASRRPLPRAYSDPRIRPYPDEEIDLAKLVLSSAERSQSEGKLDAALDRYVAAMHIANAESAVLEVRACEDLASWAAQKGQTPQRVLEALRTLDEQWRIPPLYSDVIEQNYLLHLQYLRSDAMYKRGEWAIMWRLPWERARALRLLNQLTAEKLAESQATEALLASGGHVGLGGAAARPADGKTVRVPKRDITYELVGPMLAPGSSVPNDREVDAEYIGFCLELETYRRATRLILALQAWKLEHGGLPNSLDDLLGKYLRQIPTDPYVGKAFTYAPKGLHYAVVSETRFAAARVLEPGRPFIACDTWTAAPHWPETGNDPIVCAVWKGVWVFPIP